MSQRVITIGYMGAAADTGASTLATTVTTDEATDVTTATTNASGAWELFVEEIPTILAWTVGAVAIGYVLTTYFVGPVRLVSAPRRRDPRRRSRRKRSRRA